MQLDLNLNYIKHLSTKHLNDMTISSVSSFICFLVLITQLLTFVHKLNFNFRAACVRTEVFTNRSYDQSLGISPSEFHCGHPTTAF